MARSRNIKPGVFKNELLADLSAFTRLMFIGLWTLADREGRLEDRPKRIKMELFPYDKDDADDALKDLALHGFIERYQVAGFKVIKVVNFTKHQAPHGTEKDSVLPDRDGKLTIHVRSKTGCVTGVVTTINVETGVFNVNPPLDNALIPDSPIHRITDSRSKAPIQGVTTLPTRDIGGGRHA